VSDIIIRQREIVDWPPFPHQRAGRHLRHDAWDGRARGGKLAVAFMQGILQLFYNSMTIRRAFSAIVASP